MALRPATNNVHTHHCFRDPGQQRGRCQPRPPPPYLPHVPWENPLVIPKRHPQPRGLLPGAANIPADPSTPPRHVEHWLLGLSDQGPSRCEVSEKAPGQTWRRHRTRHWLGQRTRCPHASKGPGDVREPFLHGTKTRECLCGHDHTEARQLRLLRKSVRPLVRGCIRCNSD